MTSERLYSALLHLYPRQFRLEYGEAMFETFRAARRDMAAGQFWLMIAADFCRSVPLEHWRAVGPDARRVARCALAGVFGTALLAGSITVVVGAAAGSARPINEQLSLAGLQTGWLTAGTTIPGESKVVPFVAVTLENVGSEEIGGLHLTAVFRRVDDNKGWGEAYLRGSRSNRLAPRASTSPLVLRSGLGYTGAEPPPQLLQNSQFVDVRVTLLAKRGPAQWQRLGDWPVSRELLDPR
jgi:hypothetical protein